MLQHVGPKRLIEPEKLKSHSKVPLRWEEIPVLIPFGRWVETGKFVRLVTPEILEEYEGVVKRLNVHPSVAGRLETAISWRASRHSKPRGPELSPAAAQARGTARSALEWQSPQS